MWLVPTSPPSPLLVDAIEEYLRWLGEERERTASTVAAYRGELHRFRRQAGVDAVNELNRQLVTRYQRGVASRPTASGLGPRLGSAAATRRLVVLRGFLRFAADQDWVDAGLPASIHLHRVPARAPRPLSETELRRLIGALGTGTLRERRDRALVLLLLSSGARLSELLRLNRGQFTHSRLILRTGHRQRTVIVTHRARQAVEAYLASRGREAKSAPLFASLRPGRATGRPSRLTVAGARYALDRLADRAGLAHFEPSQLRDTFGGLIHRHVADPGHTAELLGYADLRGVAGFIAGAEPDRTRARRALEAAGV